MLCMNYRLKEKEKMITFLTMDCNGVPSPESMSHSIIPDCTGAADYVDFSRLGLSIRGSRFRDSC